MASWLMNESDLLLVVGASFANHTGIAPYKPIVQVDDAAAARDGEDRYPGHWRTEEAPVEWGQEPALLAAEFRAVLERALAGLPERQRAVVELRDVHGLDHQEVCELLDLTPANQRVLLHRGRARLRGVLEGAMA